MKINKSQIKKIVEKQVQKTLDSGLANLIGKDQSKIDFLESKLEKLSGELLSEIGHARLDSTGALLSLITESVAAKLENSEIAETSLEEEVDSIVQGAASQLKEPN